MGAQYQQSPQKGLPSEVFFAVARTGKWTLECIFPSLVLFHLLKTMRIVPYNLWGGSSPKMSPEFESESDRYFRRSWAKIFRPRLFRKCDCTDCKEDKRIEIFHQKKILVVVQNPLKNE